MPTWIQTETLGVEELISDFKDQAKIILVADRALDAVEMSLECLGTTLDAYQSRFKKVIGMRQALKKMNTDLAQVRSRSPNKDGNNVKWVDQTPEAPTTPRRGTCSSRLGDTPNLAHPCSENSV